MPHLIVTPLSRLAEAVSRHGPSGLVTLLSPGADIETPPGIAPERHLRLSLSDIATPLAGHRLAAREQVEALLAFGAEWRRAVAPDCGPLVLHCYAGVSRSPAAAFALACAFAPEASERAIAERLRARSPSATPNARLVALADECLGRGGRMIGAIAAIGRGAEAFEGEVFAL